MSWHEQHWAALASFVWGFLISFICASFSYFASTSWAIGFSLNFLPPTMPIRINYSYTPKIGTITARTMSCSKRQREMIVIFRCTCIAKNPMAIIANIYSHICFRVSTRWTLSVYSHKIYCRLYPIGTSVFVFIYVYSFTINVLGGRERAYFKLLISEMYLS